MSKKRNCRRTEEERIKHDIATKVRRMTDEQLYTYMQDEYKRGCQNAKNAVLKTNSAKAFLGILESAPGIGKATYSKIIAAYETWIGVAPNAERP